ncbi:MAG TPA: hypothetical protein PKX28_09010 [Candidatus Hydrogenedentes bacterium]|nr:hypothetical protein [Candidatus Hydrogenedentota bacterium]HOJ67778.1 hypothetical protein [Candidatus Hydrogenedentota bacterium]HOK89832.1 hypothetical protein [Candidatus Hydrogenedentota bacterium]HPO31370.1 hypothetical protein [Candidatus Hydrogenedentota bacterium]
MTGPEPPSTPGPLLPPGIPPDPDWSLRRALLAELTRKWNLPASPTAGEDAEDDGFEAFVRRALAERVLDMMLRQPDRLMAALYVLDIPESAFQRAMRGGETNAAQAEALAGVILDREFQRMVTRSRYRREPAHPPPSLEQRPPDPGT